MKRTFGSEDKRKDRLFEAWIPYLKKMEGRWGNREFDEIIGGIAVVHQVHADRLSLRWNEMKKVREVQVPVEISRDTCKEDCLMVTAGRVGTDWWPLEVESIGSVVRGKKSGIHMTVNPILMAEYRAAQQGTIH